MSVLGAERPSDPALPSADAARRVDPFLLPSSTTSLFLLLVVLTLGAAAYTGERFLGTLAGQDAWYGECAEAARGAAVIVVPTVSPQPAALTVVDGYFACFSAANRWHAVSVLGWTAIVAIVLLLAARAHPWLVRRRHRLVRLRADTYPVAAAEIADCIDAAGLRRAPRLWVDGLRSGAGGRAFGFRGRYEVRLARALLLDDDPVSRATLRAVVRHELAHVRNRDLDLTALVVVVPWVFLAGVVVPYLALVALLSADEFVAIGVRLAALVVVVLVVRAAIFRTREHHADVRATVPPTDDDPLPATAFVAPNGSVGLLPRAASLLRSHPTPAARRRVVAEPYRLLTTATAEALATGVTAAVAFGYLRTILLPLLAGEPSATALVTGLAVGLLVSSVVGLGMWRATLAAVAGNRPGPSTARIASALALGLVIGDLLMPSHLGFWVRAATTGPVATLLGLALLLGVCLVYVRWCILAATTWLAGARTRSLRLPVELTRLVGAVLVGGLLGHVITRIGSIPEDPRAMTFVYTTIAGLNLTILVGILAAAAVLVAGGSPRAGDRSRPRRLLLEPRSW